MRKPLISIIIINFNGKKWLENCLPSINKQKKVYFEVLIVDNKSSDSSVSFVRNNYPEFIIVENDENFGFAKGNNIGVEHASGDYYFLLNNDTVLIETDLIEKMVGFMQNNPKIGILQPKICLMNNPGKMDLCGSFWTPTTMLYHYGFYQDENDPLFAKNFPVFTCKGAAILVRKKCVDDVGLFDPDFWCYYEETDFCHRAWLAGYQSWYFHEAKLLHHNGGTSKSFNIEFIQYHNFKNKLRSFVKNFTGLQRISVVLRFMIVSILFIIISVFTGNFMNVKAILSAYSWNVLKLFRYKDLKKNNHKVKLPPAVIKNPGLSYYIDLIVDLKKHTY